MRKKKAFIIGAASGMRRATAFRFAAEGYDLFLNDINEFVLNEVFGQLGICNPQKIKLLQVGSEM